MRVVRLDKCDGNIEVTVADNRSVRLTSTLTEPCPKCHREECYGECRSGGFADPEEEQEEIQRVRYNCFIDGMESLIMGCAASGLDVGSDAFQHGVQTAIDTASNRFS
jgi:hypothetical protein